MSLEVSQNVPEKVEGRCRRRHANSKLAVSKFTRREMMTGMVVVLLLQASPLFVNGQTTTDLPTAAPTPAPLQTPVPATPDPTPNPTPRPTPRPTRRPTRSPTKAPTDAPTPAPVVAPTTPRPTRRPTTREPTKPPTRAPTPAPIFGPTRNPTLLPATPEPTPVPTPLSTSKPTPELSPTPTFFGSRAPSLAPDAFPSLAPTAPGSGEPTSSPPPTQQPSIFPSHKPSQRPSRSPSKLPSPSPSLRPTQLPSAMPSLSDQLFDVDVTMEMIMACVMTTEKLAFEQAAKDHITKSIQANNGGEFPLFNLVVKTDVNRQTGRGIDTSSLLPCDANVTAPLQQPINVNLLTRLVFKSAETKDKAFVQGLIGVAFNSDQERQAFVDLAQRNDDNGYFFETASLLQVEVEGVVPPEEAPPSGSSTNIMVIVGAAGGGLVAILALGLLVFRRSSSFRSVGTPGDEEEEGEEEMQRSQGQQSKIGVSTEILVERQDDISTLGDPVGYGGMMAANSERDEQTASVGNDYDYTKQYLRAQGLGSLGDSRERLNSGSGSFEQQTRTSSASTGFSKTGGLVAPSIFSDDASFEQQQFGGEIPQQRFEVKVPAGKLGMVIDTPNGGVPVVHAIKAESVLASRVKVGDKLVSVDGDDVTCMTAVQVSKLISLKSDQQRTLAFARGRAGE